MLLKYIILFRGNLGPRLHNILLIVCTRRHIFWIEYLLVASLIRNATTWSFCSSSTPPPPLPTLLIRKYPHPLSRCKHILAKSSLDCYLWIWFFCCADAVWRSSYRYWYWKANFDDKFRKTPQVWFPYN